MIECHCGKCERLEEKRCKLKKRVAQLEHMVRVALLEERVDDMPNDPDGPDLWLDMHWQEYKKEHKIQ